MNHKRDSMKKLTHEEIDLAMEKFLKNGGNIKQLHTQFETPNLNYDFIDHEERQMVYEIAGLNNSAEKIN